MKLQKTPIYSQEQQANKNKFNQSKNNKHQQSFGGAGIDAAFNFLQTNQAMGATAVDIGCMGLPRTAVDFTRSPQAGLETARREFTSTFNDAFLGLYGMGAASLLATGLNKKYDLKTSGFKANSLTIDNNALDILTNIRANSGDIKKAENLDKFLDEALNNTKAFNPISENAENGMVSLSDNAKAEIKKYAKEELFNTNSDKKSFKKTVDCMKNLLISDTGVESQYKLERNIPKAGSAETMLKTSETTAADYVSNIMKTAKAFMNDKVAQTFDSAKSADGNVFVKAIKSLNSKTTALGIGFCAAIGLAAQPINIYLTKKKTGQSGFVGGGGEDKSTKFKILKGTLATAAMFGALSTITKGKFKEIPEALKFKGALPTIEQFKLVYGLTIFSRLLSARNGDELREGTIKDSLGFANWLILGNFVQKFAAMGFEKASKGTGKVAQNYLKRPTDAKNAVSRFFKSEIVSRNEILHEAMAKLNKSTIGADGKVLKFGEMHKIVNNAIKNGTLDKSFKGKLRALNFIQLAGYAYSGLVLGVLIPKLNIAITKHFQNKESVKSQTEKA